MRHARNSSPTLWGKAVDDILTAANIRQTAVAEEIGEQKAYVNRFLTGNRKPSPVAVKRIDRAIAQLADLAPVEDYLDLEALGCGLLETEHFGPEVLVKGIVRILHWYGRFFEPGFPERIAEFANASGEPARKKLIRDLNRALRRIILEEFLPPSRPVGFSNVYEVLAQNGIPLDGVVSERSAAQLARERFEWTVRRELFTANPCAPAGERLAAARRIFETLTVPALAVAEVSAKDGLCEVRTIEFGKWVSRFYGDSRAAWTPFMPSTREEVRFTQSPTNSRLVAAKKNPRQTRER